MNKPIGIFDSGVGGLTVAKEIIKKLPNENIYFFGDIRNCPYGDKTKEEILFHTEKAVDFLVKKGVKLIVLACNTATAAALEYLENKYDIPIIGVIKSGARTAIKTTKNKKVLVLGTNFTVKSGAYTKEINNIDDDIIVHNKACRSFVPFVENEDFTNEKKLLLLLEKELKNTKDFGMDTIILGCTHYPIIQNNIEKYYNNNIKIISPAIETAREVRSILKLSQKYNSTNERLYKFFISKKSTRFEKTAKKWLNKNVDIEVIDI